MTWDRIASGGFSGTPGYMAPELLEGRPASFASDVFALGIVLHEMLTHRKAIDGANILEILDRIRNVDAESLSAEVPVPFREIVRGALQSGSEARPAMSAIAAMLRDVTIA